MNSKRGLGIGSVSLILIFSVLCFTIFSLLAVSSANNDRELAIRFSRSVENYYSADTIAEIILSDLTLSLQKGEQPQLVQDAEISYTEKGQNLYISYMSKIDDNRSIAVLARYDGTGLEVLEWLETDNKTWTADEHISVFGGE